MARTRKPKRMPLLRTFHNALNTPPTTTDGVGGGYSFFVNNILKFGKSNKPRARKGQWKRQCHGEQQTWLDFHWEVPYAKKFERIIHIELKRLGAWLGRVHCRFCGRNHQEKFDLRKCGGESRFGANYRGSSERFGMDLAEGLFLIIPSDRVFFNALNALPSVTDGVGGGYSFFVNDILKFGKSNKPRERKGQWRRQCRGEQQTWLDFHWEVPYAKKFERIIHIELKRLGAWLGRIHCRFCGRNHQEKFDLRKCGGKAGLVRIVEARLKALGWIWRRVYF
ncbi:hypothetical protein B0H14DRAFT_3475365 [Mycena olivaceomarginata]|nr:hypothetical protein B0H14DRAFT_3475365 [Mycena olivaceomarginata]